MAAPTAAPIAVWAARDQIDPDAGLWRGSEDEDHRDRHLAGRAEWQPEGEVGEEERGRDDDRDRHRTQRDVVTERQTEEGADDDSGRAGDGHPQRRARSRPG